MGKFWYYISIKLYTIAFRIAALFNKKARLGLKGREDIFSKISVGAGAKKRQLLWMHCASLGEFEQGRPVLESLKQRYPGIVIALSFFSASGYEALKNYKGADQIFYLPLDSPSNAKRLLDILNPSLALWIKYEFWYYHLIELKKRHIPVLLVSGVFRASQPFFKWYGGLWREMLRCFTYFFVQNEVSRNLLATTGIVENVVVAGDTRFDRVIEIAEKPHHLPFIEQFCGDSHTLVAGSTWEDDEAELIHYVRANPRIKFIIAPHETDAENLKDIKQEFPNAIYYSELVKGSDVFTIQQTGNGSSERKNQQTTHNVLIIDNVGMLSRLYYYADITYVGGGFGADGVHNVLEAAVYGKPVIYGPEYEKYPEAVALVECGGAISVDNALELEKVLNELWQDESLLMRTGKAAKDYVYAHEGASNNIVQFVQEKRLLTN